MTYKKLLLPFCLLLSTAGNSQSVAEIKNVFPGHDIVYQQYTQELNLYLKDEVPVAENKISFDMLMLTDKNVNMLSRHKIYHSGYSELKDMEAYTRIPVGNKYKNVKITDQKVSSSTDNNVFYDDVQETSFDFPALTQNAIAHAEYTLFNKDAHLLRPFYFPYHLPVVEATYIVKVPDGMNIKFVVKNDPTGLFQFTEEKNKRETVYKWTIKNVKPEDHYADAPDFRYFQPHIIVFITSFENKSGKQSFLNSVDDLHRWNTSFTKQLNKTVDPTLKLIVDSLIGGITSEREKVIKIYQWVQQNIKYVAFENGLEGFRPRQAAEVCSKRYGDCKDMSSIITQMLRVAGVKAYYTWIGTRDLPYTYIETPLPLVDNHMIATALVDGSWIFLDGTDPNAKLDMPPAFIQGKEAMVSINENEYKILKVPVAAADKNILTDSTFVSFNENGLKGTQKVNYSGYFGKDVYQALLYSNEKETKEYVNKRMSKGSNKFLLGNYNVSKANPDNTHATISAEFELPGYSKKVGSEYFINLNLEKLFENNIIDTSKRKIPFETNFNFIVNQYHVLNIPEGYKVTYLPKDFSFENSLVKINMYYKIVNSQVVAAQEIKSKRLLVTPAEFGDWNTPMKALQPLYKESVVLEKK